jgi:divalent metal cation (Fe/Co/Zn/Cd) transporter
MFEQHNTIQKIVRIIIFILAVYIILSYLSSNILEQNNKIILTSAITIIFLIYELYFPSVRIELTNANNRDALQASSFN